MSGAAGSDAPASSEGRRSDACSDAPAGEEGRRSDAGSGGRRTGGDRVRHPLSGGARGALAVCGSIALCLLVALAVTLLPSTGHPRLDGAIGFVAGLLPVAALAWLAATIPVAGWLSGVVAAVAIALSLPLSWAGALTLAAPLKVVGATMLGRILGRQIAEAWWLVMVALLALLVDLWSVFSGPTRTVVEEAPRVLDYLLVHFAVLSGPRAGLGVGMSDFVFIGLYVVGARCAGLRVRATFLAVAGSLVLTMAVAVLVRPAIPALPLMSLAFLAINVDRLAGDIRRRLRH